MTAHLPAPSPTRSEKRSHRSFARDHWQRHYATSTSTSRTSTAKGRLLALRAAKHPWIAYGTFSIAATSVSPCEIHPGRDGHSATIMPVSSRSSVMSRRMSSCYLSFLKLAKRQTVSRWRCHLATWMPLGNDQRRRHPQSSTGLVAVPLRNRIAKLPCMKTGFRNGL